ncbi:MAG: tyrosine-type recombinase/integrase [Thiolinea sp.]
MTEPTRKYARNKLSDADVRSKKGKDKPYKLPDGGGLYCEVLPSGRKVWRYRYKFGVSKANKSGKLITPEKTYTIGTYPDIGLSDARKLRDEAKSKVSSGVDPSAEKQVQKYLSQESTFKGIALEWYEANKTGWSGSHATRTISYLERDVFPMIGVREVNTITAPELIPIIKKVSGRGAIDAAKRVKGFMQQVFDYAVVHGKADRNPARDINISLILPKTVKRHFAALKEPSDIGDLLRAIDAYQGMNSVKFALQLSPLLFLRPTELREGAWSEIDFDRRIWLLPAARRKLPMHIKQANRPEDALIIPLATQSLELLKDLYQYTGKGKFLFPSTRGKTRVISNNAVRTALRTMGYANDEMTAHGFRGMASTCLNTLRYRSEVIEAQLGHSEKNEIRAAYNHADYLAERTSMMQEWADYLDSLRGGVDVMLFQNRIGYDNYRRG